VPTVNITIRLAPTLCVSLVLGIFSLAGGYASAQDKPVGVATPTVDIGDPEQFRSLAVERARSGDHDSGVKMLQRLLEQYPDDTNTLHDLLIILGWAELDQEALTLSLQLDPAATPVSVVEAVAKSARNVRAYDESVRWYQAAVARFPDRTESGIGLALAYSDWQKPVEAMASLAAIPETDANRERIIMTRAYIYRSDGELVREIDTYDDILEFEPQNVAALRGKILAMQRLFLPQQALELAEKHPGILTDDEIGQLHTDWGAVQVRWAGQTVLPETLPEHPLDQAIQDIDQAKNEFADSKSVQLRAQFDRIEALRARQRMAEAVQEFELLEQKTADIPAYVLDAAAGAYLFLRQPDRAYELLTRALEMEPNNYKLNHDLFYVYVDLEQHRKALELSEKLRINEPVWHQAPGSRLVKANPRRMQAEITAGLSLSFADHLPESQARFEDLLSRAPNNTHLRMELAGVYRQRGWTDRAINEYQQILAIEPDFTAADIGLVHAVMDHRQYQVADERINRLAAKTPARVNVMRLQRRWQNYNKQQLRFDSGFGESSGAQFGTKQYRADAYYRTKPVAYKYRPFLHASQAFAEFPEGDSTRNRVGAGLVYSSRDWLGTVEFSGGNVEGGLGVSTQLEWFATDLWSLSGILETNSDAMPLRGHKVGVSANRAGMQVSYRASEQRRISLSTDFMDFSDGNRRSSLLLRGNQRIKTTASYKLDLGAELFTSKNTETGVAYYNPSQDTSLMATAINSWRTYRRYDFSFTQQFNAGYGVYQQESFGTEPVGFLQYVAIFDVNEGLDLYGSVRRARNVYDGTVEYGTFFNLGIGGAF
jgi:biofilm PGA synthesis protein PgaA